MIIMRGKGTDAARTKLTGRARQIYDDYAKDYCSPDWILASLCSMQAQLEELQGTVGLLQRKLNPVRRKK